VSNDYYWRAISVDSISSKNFPEVSLYSKNKDNYVLYKPADRTFTSADFSRLERSLTEFLYVRSGDMEFVNEFMEHHLAEVLSNDELSSTAKGKILYQVAVNSVVDLFEGPERPVTLQRCREIIGHLLKYIVSDRNAFKPLKSIVDQNFYFFSHAVQVAALALLVHEKLFSIDPDEAVDVGIGCLIHDFGMTFISSEILEKDYALSKVDFYKVKQHTQKGFEYLCRYGKFSDVVLNIVRFHHERYDGNGYPTALKGSDIPRSAQVVGICDVFSALIMDRAHRKASLHTDAIELMRVEVDKGAFKKELFDSFVEITNEYY